MKSAPGKSVEISPLRFETSPKAPGVLAAVIESQGKKDKTTGKRQTFYMINFIAPLRGDDYRLIILNKRSLTLWTPKEAQAIAARTHLLNLDFDDGQAPVFRSDADLEQALIAAHYLPAKHSIAFTLTATAPTQPDKKKTASTPRPSNKSWIFNSATDPITKKSNNSIIIRAASVEPRANLAINFFCDKGQLRAVLHNPDISFRNDTSTTKVALSLVEMRIDDKDVHRLVWERRRATAIISSISAGQGGSINSRPCSIRGCRTPITTGPRSGSSIGSPLPATSSCASPMLAAPPMSPGSPPINLSAR